MLALQRKKNKKNDVIFQVNTQEVVTTTSTYILIERKVAYSTSMTTKHSLMMKRFLAKSTKLNYTQTKLLKLWNNMSIRAER